MLHSMLRDMVRRGHSASVLINFKDVDHLRANSRHPQQKYYDFEGVAVFDFAGNAERIIPKADIVITHLEKGSNALHGAPAYCKKYGKPLARLVHNDRELFYFKAVRDTTDLVIFNSLWLQNAYNATLTADWNQIVVRPPVDPSYYAVDRPDANDITLINLTENKGAKLFYDLARAMRSHSFLAVKGGYDQQMIDSGANLTVIENQSDVRPVYARTRILLVPSLIETYGRVAVEAMASGIPVIANETAGLREACADAAVFLDRNKPMDWVNEIQKLDDPDYYAERSAMAKARAEYLWNEQMAGDLDTLETALLHSVATFKGERNVIKINEPKSEPQTMTVIARRNFRHKDKQYTKGVADVPFDDVGFLLGRMLIEIIKPEPTIAKAKVEEATRDDKSDKVATKRKTKAIE